MRNLIKYFAFSTILLLVSCYGKNENNFYELGKHSLNSVTVKVNDIVREDADTSDVYKSGGTNLQYKKNIIIVDANDKIEIALNSTLSDGFVPEYKWDIMELSPNKDPITDEYPKPIFLGNTKDITFDIAGSPVEYVVGCTITNTADNTQDYVNFIFKINKPNGLAIIYNTPNGGDFDFLKNDKNTINQTKVEYYKNIYSSSNTSYINDPHTLHAAKGSWGSSDVFIVFNKSGMINLGYNTFKVTSVDQTDFFALDPPVYSKADMLANGSYIYGVFNDQIYFSSTGFKFKWSIDPANSYLPMIIANDGSAASGAHFIFFDKNKKAFKYGNFNGGVNTFVTRSGSIFNIDDTKMDFVYGESGFEKNVNMIMKSGSKLYYNIIDMQIGKVISSDPVVKQTDASVLIQHEITSLTGLTESSLWAMNNRGPRAFYSSGSKIYVYNQVDNTSAEFATVSGNITMMKVYKHSNELINSKTLYVGTDAGKLYEFSFDVVTGNKIGEPAVYNVDGSPINIKYI